VNLPIVPAIQLKDGLWVVSHGDRVYGRYRQWERAARRARHVKNSSKPRRERNKKGA
jgi:hypothetical protein